MTYIVTLGEADLQRIDVRLDLEQRLTKALPASVKTAEAAPHLALVCAHSYGASSEIPAYSLRWLGMVMRQGTVGAVDKTITIDPLRRCREDISLDGPGGVLAELSGEHDQLLRQALKPNTVETVSREIRDALVTRLRARGEHLAALLTWLLGMAEPSPLRNSSAEERAWQEQQDATSALIRIADFPLSSIASWKKPDDPHAPYLAGLIPEPVEHSYIDYDAASAGLPAALFETDSNHDEIFRHDIHQFYDSNGRWLEVVNVNATPVEARLGTDLIYYHVPTDSFVLVQYKRLSPDTKSLYVDKRLLAQMNRLDEVAQLSQKPRGPADWRLASDSCFLKLAYWPDDRPNDPRQPTPGMYLPLTYARLLLADDCTLGPQGGRILSYDRIQRYLITSQFAPLVQNGLAGTVGTTIKQLRGLVSERAKEGYSVVAGVKHSEESAKQRQNRARSRGRTRRDGKRR